MYIEFLKVRLYPAAVIMTSMIGSFVSPVYAVEKPYQQTFVVTAYYSPLPNQCCYFRGSYPDEITFNGNGTHGADGTPVYPGMLAGPPTYAFGTVIDLPGVGVGTIHDRGGRIIEWGEDIHRIDVWMGSGEEGLARALAWGARKVVGTVYPNADAAPAESLDLSRLDADISLLKSLPKSDPLDLLASAELGDRQYGARVLQTTLKSLGYFTETPTGLFGPATQEALKKFQAEYGLAGDGSSVDSLTAAALTVASELKPKNLPELSVGIEQGQSGNGVRQVQKLLRYLGQYRGRTDGVFDDDVKKAVTQFQISAGVISQVTENGAGRVGPATKAAILQAWKSRFVSDKARIVAMKMEVKEQVTTAEMPTKTLASGDRGAQVKLLQAFLHDAGYLAADGVTGNFGARTRAALLKYQIEKKIVDSESSKGAGIFGPATKSSISTDIVAMKWQAVRAQGMGVL